MNWISIVIAFMLAAAVISALIFVRKHKGSCGGCIGYDECSKRCDKKQQ